MNKRKGPCKTTVVYDNILMSEDNDFMYKNKIDDECICPEESKDFCKMAIDMLRCGKRDELFKILDNL